MRAFALGALALLASTSSASNIRASSNDLPGLRRSKADVERSLALQPKAEYTSPHDAWRRAVAANGTVDACPGYVASGVKTTSSSLTATLKLAGPACNVYGPDLAELELQVTYETASRIHLKIIDPKNPRYEVPASVLPRPKPSSVPSKSASIQFKYTLSPFTFSIVRAHTNEVIFETSKEYPLVFEDQYLRLKTTSPADANIYGLGEHTETFRLPNNNLTRTLWSRDAYGVPVGTNLYGNHPVYFEHRVSGTHGVFLLSSNGMDVKINQENSKTTLEYNVIGGVFDFYFLAGPSPVEVAQQYAQVVGTPAEVPYWSLGFHQCRYGYTDYLNVAQVVQNYSRAGIPLETMWTDIDFYYQRWTFTNDPQYFPLNEMQLLISELHERGQHYILMVDPAVAYQPDKGYTAFDKGTEMDVFLKNPGNNQNFSDYFVSVVWPGMTVFPDWFHPNASKYWTDSFLSFFDPKTGIDVDGAWIDMNDPATFCAYPCNDPVGQAISQGLPPGRSTAPPPANATFSLSRRGEVDSLSRRGEVEKSRRGEVELGKRATGNGTTDWLDPPYKIRLATDTLSDRTAYTDIVHANGMMEYNTHNLYGTQMSLATHTALLARRPTQRTLVITRSTFAGAGSYTQKWLGDNLSDDAHYYNSISGILNFASIFQVPVVGADVCGFGGDTNERLCARWAMLGAFYPFYRNHNEAGFMSQEFYQWPTVAAAAKNVIDIRYRLLDYIYTAIHQNHLDGTPILNPYWYLYPTDSKTFGIDGQFFFGPSVLVSPVTTSTSTSVSLYLAKDTFYDWTTRAPVIGHGSTITLSNVSYTEIPLHIKGGSILPLRASSANTTTELRTKPFEILVATGSNGKAAGELYIDDGISITQSASAPSTLIKFSYAHGTLLATGSFHSKGSEVSKVTFLGVTKKPSSVKVNGRSVAKGAIAYDAANKVATVSVSIPLSGGFVVQYE